MKPFSSSMLGRVQRKQPATPVRPTAAASHAPHLRGAFSLLIAVGGLTAGVAQAAVVTADFTNLPDAILGQDLWEAAYSFSGMSFAAGQGFTLYYAHDSYRNLTSIIPPNHPGWDLLVVQPDPGVLADGFFDGLAVVNNPPLADPFLVTFVWLGGRAGPGQQPYETYDTSGGFRITGNGMTVPVPEPPQTAMALGLALAAGALLFRRAGPENESGAPEGGAEEKPVGRARTTVPLERDSG
jgi:hypothetical protein